VKGWVSRGRHRAPDSSSKTTGQG